MAGGRKSLVQRVSFVGLLAEAAEFIRWGSYFRQTLHRA